MMRDVRLEESGTDYRYYFIFVLISYLVLTNLNLSISSSLAPEHLKYEPVLVQPPNLLSDSNITVQKDQRVDEKTPDRSTKEIKSSASEPNNRVVFNQKTLPVWKQKQQPKSVGSSTTPKPKITESDAGSKKDPPPGSPEKKDNKPTDETKSESQPESLEKKGPQRAATPATNTQKPGSSPDPNISKPIAPLKQTDNATAHGPCARTRGPTRFLFGIFSTNEAMDELRRDPIRSSYLRSYKMLKELGNVNTICSLSDILQGKLATPNDCRIIYTFVLGGGDKNAPTELLQAKTSNEMTVSKPGSIRDRHDMLYLNVRENLNEGKSPTWFKYATTLLDEQEQLNCIHFDYVVKVDR
jgi:hypothetical protein